jgi:hypothetical protein
MAPAATGRRLACRARRVRRERGRRAGGAGVRRTRSDGRAPRSCVRSARFVSSAITVGIPEADWADLGAAAELTPSGARDARSGRERASRSTSKQTPAWHDEQARRSRLLLRDEWSSLRTPRRRPPRCRYGRRGAVRRRRCIAWRLLHKPVHKPARQSVAGQQCSTPCRRAVSVGRARQQTLLHPGSVPPLRAQQISTYLRDSVPGRPRPPVRGENRWARIDAADAWCVRARATAWRGDLWDR